MGEPIRKISKGVKIEMKDVKKDKVKEVKDDEKKGESCKELCGKKRKKR